MSQPLWLTIEPHPDEVLLSLHGPSRGSILRARLPLCPHQPRALATLLESLVAWYGRSLVAVLDADAQDVRQHGERWARLVGELDEAHIKVEWSHRPAAKPRDRFLGRLGNFRPAARMVGLAAGGGQMITPEMRLHMRRLVLAEKLPIETVARRFGVHHSTVRRALADGTQSEQSTSTSIIDAFKPYIVERLTTLPELTASRLLLELRDRGFAGSIAVLRRYVAKVRLPRSRKVYLRIETDPGEQAQVDWGHFGHMRVGSAQRPVSAFSMVLSWSRAIYVDFCFDQQMDTFCRMHRRALEFFGGVPRRIVYDNLKSVVLSRVGSVIQFNPRFLAFAGHYVFEPTAAPVRYPEYKGRVEASIKYIRHSFFYGRSFASLNDLRAQVGCWRDEIANQRLHGTTRERPADRLLVERPRFRALPPHPFDTDLVIPVIVSKEARVRLDSNSYSVPYKLVGKSVHIRADDHKVRIMHEGAEVAAHVRCWDRRRHIQDPAHIEELIERRKAARPQSRREMLAAICPESRLYFQEISRRRIRLDSELSRIFRLIDLYGQTEVAGALAKAVGQRTFGAKYVRALCDQARFARGLGEPPEPVVTGNREADSLDIQPHDMESYDDLF